MSENRISYVPTLPSFASDAPLEATALNSLTVNQEYINQRILQPVAAMAFLNIDTNYYVLHRMRYVYIFLQPLGNSSSPVIKVLVNGKRIAQQTLTSGSPSWSGVVDLEGNDLDGDPLDLVYGQKYTVRYERVSGLDYESVEALRSFFEVSDSGATPTLPASNPTFAEGQILTAAKLNLLSSNTAYLKAILDDSVNCGFQYSDTHIQAPGSYLTHNYRIKHAHKYLVVRAILDMGFSINALTCSIEWNGTEVYTTTRTKGYTGGGTYEYVTQYIDLTSHLPTVGSMYVISVIAHKDQYDDFTRLKVVWVGESPVNTQPSF